METKIDFMRWLQPDMALKVLTYLDDSADLIRASAVSRYWQNIVISNGLSKQLCIKRFPELACITRVVKLERFKVVVGPRSDPGPSSEKTDHRAYASLLWAVTTFPETHCITDPVSASSTNNYPDESIENTLDPRDKIGRRYLFWSSKGTDDPEAPETLIYNLTGSLCAVTEINVHPFQATFQNGFPIYSSKFVRFRMGHPKSWIEINRNFVYKQECADDKFIWTYTSPIFPMAQENRLQRFKLPTPVVCIGGFLQVEFLGRVQKHAADGKYYICVTHVQAIGRRLSPCFCAEFTERCDITYLKYDAIEVGMVMRNASRGHNGSFITSLVPVQYPRQQGRGNVHDFMRMLQALPNGVELERDDDDDEFEMV